MKEALINRRWTLTLPDHRADRGTMGEHWPTRPVWDVWENVRLASMYEHLKPGMVLYDVGAESGDLSALFGTWGCEIVLIEPNPKAWPSIRACFQANNLRPVARYVGFFSDEAGGGDGYIVVPSGDGYTPWPLCSYKEIDPAHGFSSLREHTDVKRTTLDDYAERTGVIPDAITIDTEGSELKVLRGAEKTLREHRPLVWVSVHAAPDSDFLAQYGHTEQDVYDFLGSVGYDARVIAVDHEIHIAAFPNEYRG